MSLLYGKDMIKFGGLVGWGCWGLDGGGVGEFGVGGFLVGLG